MRVGNNYQMPSPAVIAASVVAGAVGLAVIIAVSLAPSGDGNQVQSYVFGQVVLTDMPSESPTHSPSATPSVSPSATPSVSPSDVPSLSPSTSPTGMPSVSPSVAPSNTPSLRPTFNPTDLPTEFPTQSPTEAPIPQDYTFRLKMHWRREFYWQESYKEQAYCLECVYCNPIGDSNQGEKEGCVDLNGRDNGECSWGDQMWIRQCGSDRGNSRFSLIQHRNDGGGDQIRIADQNLCMQRVESKYIQLLDCDENEPRQRWYGFRPYEEPFELRPAEKMYRCLTQNHHPKSGEVAYCGTCETAIEDGTNLWEAID